MEEPHIVHREQPRCQIAYVPRSLLYTPLLLQEFDEQTITYTSQNTPFDLNLPTLLHAIILLQRDVTTIRKKPEKFVSRQ